VDALNSAVRDERDTGAFYYYTPEAIQELFKEIADKGMKHSGNYGMFGAGFYMGQGANVNDVNDNWHRVVRFTYPWKTESGQIYEAGIQGYKGRYVRTIAASYTQPNGGSQAITMDSKYRFQNSATTGEFDDDRAAVSFRMYPQPWGLEGEWNWGTTPGLDLSDNKVANRSLHGGYIQGSYYANDVSLFNSNIGNLIPFLKWQYFDGYNKAETSAPQNRVNDWELGVEWQIAPEVELAAVYHRMKRTNMTTGGVYTTTNGAFREFEAEALRLQLQYNFF
jgi:phosphate-selective porin